MYSRVLCFFLTFFWGAIPFSLIVGGIVLRKDIRKIGDGNLGASNVFRSGGRFIGVLALVLDYGKGFLPLFLVLSFYEEQLSLLPFSFVLIALAPVLGHAYSPFLSGQGGKAVAVTFGIWSALTLWVVPTTMGLVFVLCTVLLRVRPDGWTVLFGWLVIPLALLIFDYPFSYFWIWLGNGAVLGMKHRKDLKERPSIRGGTA